MAKWTSWFPEDKFTSKVTFYLPSRRRDGSEIAADRREKLVRATMNFLLLELGGATQIEGRGFFVGEGKKVHEEQTTLCVSSCKPEILEAHGKTINQLANSLAIEFEQEAIAVEIDGTLVFFAPNDTYRRTYANLRKKWAVEEDEALGYFRYLREELEHV